MQTLDIYRSASVLIGLHGPEGALIHAASRSDKLLDAGDLEGRDVWRRIRRAIQEMGREREPGEVLN